MLSEGKNLNQPTGVHKFTSHEVSQQSGGIPCPGLYELIRSVGQNRVLSSKRVEPSGMVKHVRFRMARSVSVSDSNGFLIQKRSHRVLHISNGPTNIHALTYLEQQHKYG